MVLLQGNNDIKIQTPVPITYFESLRDFESGTYARGNPALSFALFLAKPECKDSKNGMLFKVENFLTDQIIHNTFYTIMNTDRPQRNKVGYFGSFTYAAGRSESGYIKASCSFIFCFA